MTRTPHSRSHRFVRSICRPSADTSSVVSGGPATCYNNQVPPVLKKHIALPQDHGSWVFILTPLTVGIAAAGAITLATAVVFVTSMALFLLRQPVAMLVKVISGRRRREELTPILFWTALYGLLALAGAAWLMIRGWTWLIRLAIPGIAVFVWHLWLVSKRQERKQMGIELVAVGVLSLAAPAALWITLSEFQVLGWWLWLICWMQAAASIVYAYARLSQRALLAGSPAAANLRRGSRSLAYASANFLASVGIGALVPRLHLIWLPFLLQLAEVLWGNLRPAIGWQPTRVGFRQLAVSTAWTGLCVAVVIP